MECRLLCSIEEVLSAPWWGPTIGNFAEADKMLTSVAMTLLVANGGEGLE